MNKIKLLLSNIDSTTNNSSLYLFFSGKLYEKSDKINSSIQNLFKELIKLCENYMRYDANKITEDPQSFITM